MFRRLSHLAWIMVLTLATGSPALAAQITRVVHSRDLDLNSQAGLNALRIRVFRAASFVCRRQTLGSYAPDAYAQCLHETVRDAQPQVRAIVAAARAASDTRLASR